MTEDDKQRLIRALRTLRTIKTRQADDMKKRLVSRFKDVSARLEALVLDEFRQHEWPRFKMLNEIFEQNWGLPVPTLSACGEGTAEIRFTKLLAYYFDSRNQHGLGGLLAAAVFADKLKLTRDAFKDCKAEAEVSLPSKGHTISNSIDVVITVKKQHDKDKEHKIFIEQKINSSEGEEQLTRYSEGIIENFSEYDVYRFYLTPSGRTGSEVDWETLSHRELLFPMSALLDEHPLSNVARHNLKSLLWDLILGPLAQDPNWMKGLKRETKRVAEDHKHYLSMRGWLRRYSLTRDEMKVIARIVGD